MLFKYIHVQSGPRLSGFLSSSPNWFILVAGGDLIHKGKGTLEITKSGSMIVRGSLEAAATKLL